MYRSTNALALCALLLAPAAGHGDNPGREQPIDKTNPEEVLAYQGDAVLTQHDIDAAFSRIPEAGRLLFIRDGAKVDQLVRSLLHARIVAEDARENGFGDDPLVAARIAQAIDKELAEAWVQEIESRAPEADFEAMAREDYLAHPEKYSTGELIDVTHILISTEDRKNADARALAEKLSAQLREEPGRFDHLVAEYSDDPAKDRNKGRYEGMSRGQMVKPFERAAFALEQAGEISDPVKTEYGYHLIRLDARHAPVVRPYEKVKDEAVAAMRKRHVDAHRTRYLQKLIMEPVVIPEGAVEIMARRHFGENLEKAPNYNPDRED